MTTKVWAREWLCTGAAHRAGRLHCERDFGFADCLSAIRTFGNCFLWGCNVMQMSDTLARLLAALWQISRLMAVLGILAFGLALSSMLFVVEVEGWERAKRKIKQLAERKRE